ncbi:MAG: YdcF family protein [Sinobacteraceae bacterium]|nr:YdcF family protein [Nevskiaceae bacterium]
MTFYLSKAVWALLSPGSLLLFALLAALLWHRRRPRLARAALGLATLALGLLSLCPAAHWVLTPLERRFPRPELPATVDGIVVLGGAIDMERTLAPDLPELNDAADRLTAFLALARRYPGARLVYSGGSGLVRAPQAREADAARALLSTLGLDPARVLWERYSRNTWENALYAKQLADPRPGETWLLVTSAWHMPRAVGCFRKAGWNVLPYPVDDWGSDAGDWFKFDAHWQLYAVATGEREWLGLLAYHLLGRTSAWFPAPESSDARR